MKVKLTDGVDVTFTEFDVEFTEDGTLLNGEGDDGLVVMEAGGRAIGSLWFNAPVGPSDEGDRIGCVRGHPGRLQKLAELIRAAERASDPENFEENDDEIETLHLLIRELAAAVDGHS